MTIQEYIKKINEVIRSEEEYEKYIYIFKEYIDYLELLLEKEPAHIKAVCQLAIAYYEDRRDCDYVISLLEETMIKYEKTMRTEELCEILNDLAYFYNKEYDNTAKAISLLERAVLFKTPYIHTYYALANLYLDINIDLALQMFNKILKCVPQNIEYKYQLGYCLLVKKEFEQALCIFKPIAEKWNDNNELSEKAYYCCALALLSLDKKREAAKIADDLYLKLQKDRTESIDAFNLIDLYYALGDNQKVCDLFESSKDALHFSKEELPIIFYSFHALGDDEKCKVLLETKIRELNDIIETYQKDDVYTNDEKNEMITFFEHELALIKNDYFKVMELNKRPNITNIYGELKVPINCYLIDCPRHYDYFKL